MCCAYIENIPSFRKCTAQSGVKNPDVRNFSSYDSEERERANVKANDVKC